MKGARVMGLRMLNGMESIRTLFDVTLKSISVLVTCYKGVPINNDLRLLRMDKRGNTKI